MLVIIISCLLIENVTRYFLRDSIELSTNPGVAFGIMKDFPGLALTLAIITCLIILCVCLFARIKKMTRAGLALISGGALSNLLERIFCGYVIDWIEFPFLLDLRFNLSDVFISLGALIVFISLIQQKNNTLPENLSQNPKE
ncbi:MAG: signal peptidase II [Synergistaceae bacterium]|nr:signal peptidase II [Synergistaceae bacterium]